MAEDVKKTTKSKGKTAKKGFYDVEVPLTALKVSLYGISNEQFEGRTINLDLTKSLRGRSLELKMKIKNEDGKLKAFPIKANLAGSYIRRSMRRGIDYVEDSFKTNCRDAITVIKPFFITRRRVSRSVRQNLRSNAKKYIESYLKIRTTKELFSDIIANKLQKGLALKLKKVYPLAMCEIRAFEILREKPLEEIKEDERKKLIEENDALEKARFEESLDAVPEKISENKEAGRRFASKK